MNACTAFIFAALIEFTFVNYWYRKQTCRVGGGGGLGGFGFNPVYGGRETDADGVGGDNGIELASNRALLEGRLVWLCGNMCQAQAGSVMLFCPIGVLSHLSFLAPP